MQAARPGPVLSSKRRLRWPWRSALLLWLALALPAWAADALRVGQLSGVQGEVWLQQAGGGWIGSSQQPLVNWPLVGGDRVRTAAAASAVLRIGGLTLRLDGATELALQRLDEQAIVVSLDRGSVALHLVDPAQVGVVELVTAEGRWRPQRVGHYRFDRLGNVTQATTWRGLLRFDGHDSTLAIADGQRADIWLEGAGAVTHYAWAGVAHDAFSDWVARDESGDEAAQTASYVSPEMTGWQDLDRYGQWADSAEYGIVWLPGGVAADWTPYRDGRWAWVAPWGWTWIDAAPWGFAPLHYGRWVQWRGRWCWAPEPRQRRPAFAPVIEGWATAPRPGGGVRAGARPPPPVVVVPRLIGERPQPPRAQPDRRDERPGERRNERGVERRDDGRDAAREAGRNAPGANRERDDGPRAAPVGNSGRPAPRPTEPAAPPTAAPTPPVVPRAEAPRVPVVPPRTEPPAVRRPPPAVTPPAAVPERAARPERPDRPDRPERSGRGDPATPSAPPADRGDRGDSPRGPRTVPP